MSYYQDLLAAAAKGELVLTVNKRLARHLQQLFAERMRCQGVTAWQTPVICSLESWLLRSLAELGEDWRLLSPFAAQRLWEEVIEDDLAGCGLGLLQVPAAAKQAAEAHRLLAEYAVALDGYPLTEDHWAFVRWRELYLARRQAGAWIDDELLPKVVCEGLSRGELSAPKAVWLVGFDEVTPRVEQLRQSLQLVECQVRQLPPAQSPVGERLRLACADAAGEVRQAARWARQLLEAGNEGIGIVVTDLNQYRLLIEKIFREELDPESLLRLDDEEDRFSLSLGASLAEQGPVTAALELLAAGPSLSLDQLSFLLRSPYLQGSLAEGNNRARLERAIRGLRVERLSRSRLQTLCGQNEKRFAGCASPGFAVLLETLARGEAGSRKRLASDWARQFTQTLQAAGWPGERPLGSREFQIVKAWQEKALAGLIALDGVTGPMERSMALSLLRRLATETPFQAEGVASPLQVVGLLEAAGLDFDHLWVMGLSEDCLPAAPRPNAFLPSALQKACAMPHASAERELDFARKVAGRLFAAAPRIILSHPTQQGDCPVRPSPLLAELPAVAQVSPWPGHNPVAVLQNHPAALETLVDPQGPALEPGELVSGGTFILKDQALCPFRAFAHHRLGAKALDSAQLGLDPMTRGTLLHGALEQFWRLTGSQINLLSLDDQQLESRLAASVDFALQQQFGETAPELSAPLLTIERRRLTELTRDWLLAVECRRAPFAVAALEQPHQETLGGLTINTKVDRIDQLADGSRIILDYKTGRSELGDLLGERLLEPQLPIYATRGGEGGEGLAAVVFALVRRGECAIKGVARESGLLPGVAALAGSRAAEQQGIADWAELLERWRTQLEQLGAAFVSGAAAVDPVDLQKACKFCDLGGFCRIGETALDDEEEP